MFNLGDGLASLTDLAQSPSYSRMNKKARLICCIVAVIVSLCLLITVIAYIVSSTTNRPRTPDGTKPTKAPPKKSTVETWQPVKDVWVNTLPTRPATIVTLDPNATLTVTSTTTTITPWFVSTTSASTTTTTNSLTTTTGNVQL